MPSISFFSTLLLLLQLSTGSDAFLSTRAMATPPTPPTPASTWSTPTSTPPHLVPSPVMGPFTASPGTAEFAEIPSPHMQFRSSVVGPPSPPNFYYVNSMTPPPPPRIKVVNFHQSWLDGIRGDSSFHFYTTVRVYVSEIESIEIDPPELEIIPTPRSGATVKTHRLDGVDFTSEYSTFHFKTIVCMKDDKYPPLLPGDYVARVAGVVPAVKTISETTSQHFNMAIPPTWFCLANDKLI